MTIPLLGFFDNLCGQRAKEINVRKKENFRFEPKLLLRGLSQVTSQILSADEGSFYASLSANQDLELNSFRKMCQLMREEGVGWSDRLCQLIDRLVRFILELICVCNGTNSRPEIWERRELTNQMTSLGCQKLYRWS